MNNMNKKHIATLQWITPDNPNEDFLVSLTEKICRNGCRWVQLRLKSCSDDVFLRIGKRLRDITRRYYAVLLINDRVHLVEALNANGVHVGKNDTPVEQVRNILSNQKIIGATANTLSDCLQHIENSVDYIGLGPFRFTETKKNLSSVLGINGYKEIMQRLPVSHPPVIAIGGITLPDIPLLQQTGVNGIAVSSALSQTPEETGKWIKIWH